MHNDLTTNKLLILYILNKVNAPIYSSELITFILENDFCDYFNIQHQIGNLLKSNLIESIEQNKTILYHITKQGSQAIEFFTDRINKYDLELADKFCETIIEQNHSVYLYEASIVDYTESNASVICSILQDDKEIFSMTIKDKNLDDANDIKKNWKENGKDIYNFITKQLQL